MNNFKFPSAGSFSLPVIANIDGKSGLSNAHSLILNEFVYLQVHLQANKSG